MSSPHPKPTILLVTGSAHLPVHYDRVLSRLSHLGFPILCPRLPTNNAASPPTASHDSDVRLIRSLAESAIQRGHDVVAVLHSYGGAIGSNALAGLGKRDLRRADNAGVKALIYMCALVPFENEVLAGEDGANLPPFLNRRGDGTLSVGDPETRFYGDLTRGEQERWAEILVPYPLKSQTESVSWNVERVAWRSIPATYLFCSRDQTMPMEVQEMFVQRIEAEEGVPKVRREVCDAGHSPFLSMPEKVVDMIVSVSMGG